MNTKTAYNHYTRLKEKLNSIHRAAICACSPHAEIVATVKKEVWEDPALSRCPGWVRSLLGERSSVHLEEIHRFWVVWAFETPSGVLKHKWEDLTEDEKTMYTKEGKTGAHYWLKLRNKNGYSWFDIEGSKATANYEVTLHKF